MNVPLKNFDSLYTYIHPSMDVREVHLSLNKRNFEEKSVTTTIEGNKHTRKTWGIPGTKTKVLCAMDVHGKVVKTMVLTH